MRGTCSARISLGEQWIDNVAMLAQLETPTLISLLVERAREIVGADRATLFLVDRGRKAKRDPPFFPRALARFHAH